jgi:hypothetical protein
MSEESEPMEPQVEESEPVQEEVVPAEPVAAAPTPQELQVTVDGRTENVTQKEYEYLANMGAQSLVAAQYSYQQQQAAQTQASMPAETDTSYYDENEDTDTIAAQRIGDLNKRIDGIEQNVYQQQVDVQTDNIKGQVEDSITNSPVFQAVTGVGDTENIGNDIRREIYNKQLQEKMPTAEAVKHVEAKYAKILGVNRQNWLLNKIKNVNNAAEATGGGSPSSAKPMTAKDWNDGKLLQSITAKLNAVEL